MDYSDKDIILWLSPHAGPGFQGASDTISLAQNAPRYIAAPHRRQKHRDVSQGERTGTESPKEHGVSGNAACLAVRFSQGTKTSDGVVCGCGAYADLLIDGCKGISKRHLTIYFDDQNRPRAKDLGSRYGSKVTYSGEEAELETGFSWPLDGPSITKGKPPVLSLANHVQFEVFVANHDYNSPEYLDQVKKFRLSSGGPANRFDSLNIDSNQETPGPPGKQMLPARPSDSSRVYKKELGKGSFGVVTYKWDMQTRAEYVVKEPRNNSDYVEEYWKKEADIMKTLSHEHIVKFRKATFDPHPRLEFEYVAGGSLENYRDLSPFERAQVLYQLSSALKYLHNQNPSIAHRDIKPENVLVQHQTNRGIYVKFADFGLSKAADLLKTHCGTRIWAAPEIQLKWADPHGTKEDQYTVGVDIWSLGLLVASLECGLPDYQLKFFKDGKGWIHEVQRYVKKYYAEHNGKLLRLIIECMLIEDPKKRSSADHISTEALKILESMKRESEDAGALPPLGSTFGAQPLLEAEGLDGITASPVEVRGGEDIPSPSESSGDEGLSSGSGSSSGSGATAVCKATAQTGDPHEEGNASSVALPQGSTKDLVETRSKRKRSLSSGNSSPSPTRSSPSADKQRSISRGPTDHKRGKMSKDS